jgi:predicted RNA-binding protein with PUA-like domain
MNYWLAKSEPETYSWTMLVQEGRTAWTGVRNYTARNNLRAMKTSDAVFFYHSGDEKSVVGVARVVRESYPTREQFARLLELAETKA